MEPLKTQQQTEPYSNSKRAAGDGRKRGRQCLPLSSTQHSLWLSEQRNSLAAPRLTARFRLQGKFNRRALLWSLDRIVARHAALRAVFRNVAGEPVQTAEPPDDLFALVEQDVDGDAAIEQISRQEALNPFDLAAGPLVRGRLLRKSKTEHVLLITFHRLISDRRSLQVFRRELIALYESFALGRNNPLQPLEFQFSDYAGWQRQHLTDRTQIGESGSDRPRTLAANYFCTRFRMLISADIARKLRELSARNGVSLFVTLLTGFGLSLSRSSGGQKEVTLGTRSPNRPHPELEALVGPFEQVIPVRVSLQGDPTVRQLLQKTRAAISSARMNLEAPAVPVQIVMEMIDHAGQSQLPGLTLREERIEGATTQFEITLSVEETEEGLAGTFEYARELHSRDSIGVMSVNWRSLLVRMVEDDERRVSGLLA